MKIENYSQELEAELEDLESLLETVSEELHRDNLSKKEESALLIEVSRLEYRLKQLLSLKSFKENNQIGKK